MTGRVRSRTYSANEYMLPGRRYDRRPAPLAVDAVAECGSRVRFPRTNYVVRGAGAPHSQPMIWPTSACAEKCGTSATAP